MFFECGKDFFCFQTPCRNRNQKIPLQNEGGVPWLRLEM